ncbi:MAG TPA: TldD/PmbA family protein, partial [Gammaproteobacteria bacterium]
RGVFEPVTNNFSLGASVTVSESGGTGYAATSDLSTTGLRDAAKEAQLRARVSAAYQLFDASRLTAFTIRQETDLRAGQALPTVPECIDLTARASDGLASAVKSRDARDIVVDWHASMEIFQSCSLLLSSAGGRLLQAYAYVSPGVSVVAHEAGQTQQRSHNGGSYARQGGLDQIAAIGFSEHAERIVDEALALLSAPECPNDNLDLLLLPSQMALQIHESIGHPLELDRILGDERNYAGSSFVTLDMFGKYRYGSECLNVCFEPERENEVACFAFDDEGTPATRQFLIKDGILVGAIGSATSRLRANVPAAASARAVEWNRAPIDRMGNINMLPGENGLNDLINSIELGVLMDTNRSWSIDHQRNKFQFGCEFGRRIVDGELGEIVRNPGYRGMSAKFWRNLDKVGDESTQDMLGTLYCGKGEPNQLVHVGHGSPACLFRNVEVFGGS